MLTIQLKRLGKKKIKHLNFDIEEQPDTLKELIEVCVKAEVKRYNEKRENIELISFLTPKDIQEQSSTGKISIGDIENTTLAAEEGAIENALQCFKDGLFVVFVDDEEIKQLDQKLNLNSESIIAFMRMTFLVGTYW